MSYDANKHQLFSERCKNLAIAYQNLREEAAKLDAIYVNETVSGTDPAWVDTSNATAAEHVDLITTMRAYADFWDNVAVSASDRTQHITPFLANG